MASKKTSAAAKNLPMLKRWWETLGVLLSLKNPPRRFCLFGRKGSGKTTWAMVEAAKARSMGIVRYTAAKAHFPDALYGKFLLKGGSTFWADGFASKAARPNAGGKASILLIDEMNHSSEEMDSTYQAILDDPQVCQLSLDNGEVITPADDFMVIATMNGTPDVLAEPVRDRFDIIIRCDEPHEGIFKGLRPDVALAHRNALLNEPPSAEWQPDLRSTRLMRVFTNLTAQGLSDEWVGELLFGAANREVVLNSFIDAQRNSQIELGVCE